jgi:nitric oxide reductase subunit B
MHSYRRLWTTLIVVCVASFAVLGGVGHHLISHAPPIPTAVVTPDGSVLFTGTDIQDGQGVWQSIGGQEIGTVWGHGAYVAPDWTADLLHREALFMLNTWALQQDGAPYDHLAVEQQAALDARLRVTLRSNTYNPDTGTITIPDTEAAAFATLEGHYADVFGNGRSAYAIPKDALTDTVKQRQMAAFFWWTAWASTTNRLGDTITYTNNWPHEPLVGNEPTPGAIVWSVVSIVLLLAAIGAMVWYFASQEREPETEQPPAKDPLLEMPPTPSQRASIKYFFVVGALLLVQIGCGILTAHYSVEGEGFFGIPLAKWLPYAITRTWHLQLGIFWIATSWLATGLFVAPAVGGAEPKGQRLGVNLLFIALVLVVGGSLAGEWFGIEQKLGNLWFWFGSQGYEYLDLGRFWQILLFVGLTFWLWLMVRALRPALRMAKENRSLLLLFVLSSVAIPLFYAAGLMYGQRSNLVTAEYWRWWVVHLWVEGFFEVFATVVIAFLFTRLRLLSVATATRAALFSTIIYLSGGIIGTFHHLYFTGVGPAVIALGAVFSAMEVVPLVMVGFEAWENIRRGRERERVRWVASYKWPIWFFVAVAFWNFVGAGIFGFLINPPISLYYIQGLNTTAVHAHTALFGVYGMLGIGLMLFCLRAWQPGKAWKDKPLAISFWSMNLGLALMVVLSLLPLGLLQAWASVQYGTWYARSAEFLQTPLMNVLRWLRVPGDTIFTIGVLALCWFLFGLLTGGSYEETNSGQ